jgi:hypothetical protein
MKLRAPIGQSDFRRIREDRHTYVDKTTFVQRVLDIPSVVLLFPRPRRFGKTLNLSTLRYFIERRPEDLSAIFEGLTVWHDPEARRHFQRYPVIFLTFKDLKFNDWATCRAGIARLVATAVGEQGDISGGLSEAQKADLKALETEQADDALLTDALRFLTSILHTRTGERVAVLLDEYDTPIHAAFLHGYYGDAVGFFRNFLSAGFKDNNALFKGVMTGILRIAKENLFSGLNNLDVFGILQDRFSDDFGFTEDEVADLAKLADAEAELPTIRAWYNGYRFGPTTIYNPWSVLKFLSSPASGPDAYWVATSANDLLREVMLRGGLDHPADLEGLLAGESVSQLVEEGIVLREIFERPSSVWNLLLYSGYLTATHIEKVRGGHQTTLRIPNLEVIDSYHITFSTWLSRATGGPGPTRDLHRAILAGDAEQFERILGHIMRDTLSFHDLDPRVPERVYHAFLAGLLVSLAPDYEVRSNRESGYGRYDVMILPRRPTDPGVVMELKALDKETLEAARTKAQQQLIDRQYAAELRARGVQQIRGYVVVFDGKEAHVTTVDV